MSVKTITRIWEHSGQSSSDLLLLLAIADHADDEGVCWPGIPTLAKKTRSSERQTQRNVEKLAERGELYISRRCGRGNSNLYFVTTGLTQNEITRVLRVRFELGNEATSEAQRILFLQSSYQQLKGDTDDTIYNEEKGDIQSKKVTSGAVNGDIAMSPEPSIEPSFKPSGVGGLPPTTGVEPQQISPLLPDTPEARILFAKLDPEFRAKGRRPPKRFPTLACKQKFAEAAGRLNGHTKEAIDRALQKGITGISEVTDFIAKYHPSKGPNQSGQTSQTYPGRKGQSGGHKLAPRDADGDAIDRQLDELRRKNGIVVPSG